MLLVLGIKAHETQHPLLLNTTGHATQLTPRFAPLERVYTGTIRLGVTTTTYDATGKQVNDMPWSHITDDDIQAAVHKLRGDTQQVGSTIGRTDFAKDAAAYCTHTPHARGNHTNSLLASNSMCVTKVVCGQCC